MARKRPDANEIIPPPLDGDVVPDGDFAGMRTDDVVRALTDGLHDALGEADLPTAGCALDLALREYLQVVEGTSGPHGAKVAALAFCETCLPFASLPVPVTQTYAEAQKRIRGHRK